MWKIITIAVVLSFALTAVLVATNGCKSDMALDKTKELESVEIREYQGEKISSVNDFRENSIKGTQHVDIEGYRLEITGLVENPQSYTYNEVISKNQLYKKVVTLNCVEGWSATILWEGLLVRDLLEEANPLANAKVAIFHAQDGYTTSLPIEYIIDNNIIMAYKMNEITLPAERGFPFQLITESKWGYKWIKWITKIELSDNVSYRGYWESRGYSNSADLDKGFFE
ncbi:molybdopterin-dependent oxidoreductase [Candidatus Omnitrophota bacterium]